MPPRSRRRLGRTAITAIRLPREPRHWALIEIVLVIALKLLIVVGSPHGLLVIGPPRPEHRGPIVIEPTEPLAPLAAHDPAALEILQAVTGRSKAAAWASRWRCSSALTRSARDGSFDAASALVDRLHDGQYAQPASSSLVRHDGRSGSDRWGRRYKYKPAGAGPGIMTSVLERVSNW